MSDYPKQLRDLADEILPAGFIHPHGKIAVGVMLCESADEIERLTAERDALKLQAQIWAGEDAAHKATLCEIYQAVTGKTGEPGDWNGARPVVEELKSLRQQCDHWMAEAMRYCGNADFWRGEAELIRDQYKDLIMQVNKKFPDETRHDTAKRYIQEREAGISEADGGKQDE